MFLCKTLACSREHRLQIGAARRPILSQLGASGIGDTLWIYDVTWETRFWELELLDRELFFKPFNRYCCFRTSGLLNWSYFYSQGCYIEGQMRAVFFKVGAFFEMCIFGLLARTATFAKQRFRCGSLLPRQGLR